MNYKMILTTLGKTMLIIGVVLLVPMAVGFIYGENTWLSFLVPMLSLFAIGLPLTFLKTEEKAIHAREGFIIVVAVWLIISLFGCLPFIISGSIPSFVDAFFETVSGFTTTGASILNEVESLPKSLLFWRSFTHFLGGMGVLVFVLIIIPTGEGFMHVFRAESPGPSVGKLVSKLKFTARILYAIYCVLTLILFVLLLICGMPVFDSICHAFGTAGTGGFSVKNTGIMFYDSVAIEMVISVFMVLFSINFSLFYLILIGSAGKAFKSEELRAFIIILIVSIIAIAINLTHTVYATFWESLRYSFFQVAAISSTTGFASANFDLWPTFSKLILMFLMVVGACAGSTGGGMKVSRLAILTKSSVGDLKKLIRPRSVVSVKFEGEPLAPETVTTVRNYLWLWFVLLCISTILISLQGFGDLTTNLSAAITTLGNVGPGFNEVGPIMNFSGYSAFSKIVLSINMLAGRLEIFPLIILFMPSTWKKV
ncbi:MAG: TrkH family potassium uptake protein [Clostridia bacterium]|nr:TrkH family potassium uptake protein [Clostridia bacterium]